MNDLKIRLACTVLASASILLVACGGEQPVAAPQREASEQVSSTRSALADAAAAAGRYGQAHLGHYRDLRMKHLKAEGLEIPKTVSLEIKTTHTSYCVRALNGALPTIHPWAVATVTSKERSPSPSDRCSA